MDWAMDRVAHLLAFIPGELNIAPVGSGLPNTVCFVKENHSIRFDVKLEPGIGIVIRLPLLDTSRKLRAPKMNFALEPFVSEPFTGSFLEIGADDWDWEGESPLEGYQFGTTVGGGPDMFQFKVISEGPGRDRKFFTFTCSSGGDLDRFLDALLGI